jgi:hypothetical protein
MSRAIVSPAAPAPLITIFASLKFLPATFIAVINPAKVMMAVPHVGHHGKLEGF